MSGIGINSQTSPFFVFVLSELSLASVVAQVVKNLPAMEETQVRFLGWEVPLEKR